MPSSAFIYDDLLSRHVLRENHVMVPTRLRYTYDLLDSYKAFHEPNALLVKPRQASLEELLYFHLPNYVDAVRSLSRGEAMENPDQYSFSETGDNPPFPGMYEASLWSTGASLTAAEILDKGDAHIAFNISGGLHHAMPGYASGFCIFNDPVIAIKYLLKKGYRVAYVDIDAHHGDGVQHAFYSTKNVITISLHESGQFIFPGTGFPNEIGTGEGRGYSINVPFYPYTTDDIYMWAFQEVVPPLIKAFKPDVLVTQLGIDTYFRDPITHMKLTIQGFAKVVSELGKLTPGKWLALGGGGYAIDGVARAWSMAYSVMLGKELPDEIPQKYREQYGVVNLRDQELPNIDKTMRDRAWEYAQKSVAEVRRLTFPLHSL